MPIVYIQYFNLGTIYTFFGGGGFSMGREVPGGELSEWNFTLGEFAKIHIHFLSYYLFADIVLDVKILRGIVRGKYLSAWNRLEYFSVGGWFSMGEILHGRVFYRISSSEEIFCQGTFLLGGGGICEKKFLMEGVFSA